MHNNYAKEFKSRIYFYLKCEYVLFLIYYLIALL
jgi:hypothetical protein